MAVLVTGCAGYIGSIASKRLIEAGYEVIGVDNLSTGFRENVPEEVKFYNAAIESQSEILEILKTHKIEAVMHFAGYIQVGESVQDPKKYFDNNLLNNISFLDTLITYQQLFDGQQNLSFVFSSSAAVYGNPEKIPIMEFDRKETINPYGETKLAFENLLKYYCSVYKINYIALRYFNVCGAYGDYGECHEPETHLIPLVLDAALAKRDSISIFGTDYATDDGTAVRDYIHVVDLIDAHILALKALSTDEPALHNKAYNLGSKGFSVKEIIDSVKKVTGKDFLVKEEARRAGDPDKLIADSSLIKTELGWQAKHDIETIIKDAYAHRVKYHQKKNLLKT